MDSVAEWGNASLVKVDEEIHGFIEKEKRRQKGSIALVSSENFTSRAVLEALGSPLTNNYSEAWARPGPGSKHVDAIESICKARALQLFGLDPFLWGVNVQPYSGSPANFALYTAVLKPHDRIMGLHLSSGGHLTHGYYSPSGKKVSATSVYFESYPYKVDPDTGYADYHDVEEKALEFRPKLLICGASAYPREWDYAKFREIANKCGAMLLCDMANAGLVATQEGKNPFEYCDMVTTITHKCLRGPRAGMIFYRKGPKPSKNGRLVDDIYSLEDKVNFAVFPSYQGGPHNHQIAALAVALKQAMAPNFKAYTKQIIVNAVTLGNSLMSKGYKLVTDGTDNYLLLWDLRPLGITGNKMEKVCDLCKITINKNVVPGDTSARVPGGVRIGTPAMTSRGLKEADFEQIAEFLHNAMEITLSIQAQYGNLFKDFSQGLDSNDDIEKLKVRVEKFARSFDMAGFDV